MCGEVDLATRVERLAWKTVEKRPPNNLHTHDGYLIAVLIFTYRGRAGDIRVNRESPLMIVRQKLFRLY